MFCRFIAPKYNLCITASRIIDWGVPAVHFLSDVTWNDELRKEYKSNELLIRKRFPRSIFYNMGKWIAGRSSRTPMVHDTFVANSSWTAKISSKYCQQPIKVVSPVVPGEIH